MHNTSRVDDEPYPQLLQEKGFGGFPSLCFMDAEGNVLVRQSARTVVAFEGTASRLKSLFELRAKVESLRADASKSKELAKAERDLLFVEMDLQCVAAQGAKARAEKLALGGDDMAAVEQYLLGAEIRELRGKARELGPEETSNRIAAMAKAGKTPPKDQESFFWQMTLTWAAKNGDAELGQRAFDVLDKQPAPDAMKKRLQTMLEQSKSGGK